jgi:uncharacterized protein (DUF362 family)/NAD-dependent dihydropyrimidine dehydrogenase PreA subunit
MTKVLIYECLTYEAVAPLVERAFQEFAPPLAGRRVFIKPNILGPCPPEEHVTTHPALVAAAVEACRRRQAAEIIVGDNPGMTSYGSTEHAARVAGIVEAADGCYRNIADAPQAVRGATARIVELPVSRAVLEADFVISLPKMKTHVATGLTGAVKNTYGYVIGAAKTQIHACNRSVPDFARAIVDVFAIRPPDLSIMDAVYAMEGQGPSGGRPRFVGRLLASRDAVALDACAGRMMGFKPGAIAHLAEAERRGLGVADLSRIETVGRAEPIPGFRRPPIGLGFTNRVVSFLSRIYVTQPRANRKACVRCGACGKQCPVGAIRMDPYPKIDPAKCISCYCCHEFCRHKAMDFAPRLRWLQALRGKGR